MKTTRLILTGALLGTMQVSMAEPVAIVNPKMSAKLTQTDLKNIYLGSTKSFPDGSTAIPIGIKEGPTRSAFIQNMLGKTESQYKAMWSRLMFTGTGQPPKEIDNEEEIKRLVAANPSIIGYIDSSKVDTSVRDATK